MKSCPACQHEFQVSAGGEIPYRCPHCGASVLGPYCDLEWIGGGGMGDVYQAREPEMGDRTVAIKIPRTEINAQRAQRRFEREIAASARLQHENAVRAYHRGVEGERPYLVMEFVSGRKLSQVVSQEHPLAPRRVARIALGVVRGLHHAGGQGVVNRDVKPENIFLAEPDETAKILDYGLALITDLDEQVTRYGSMLGTPNYAAPEQFRDPHSVEIAADVYSLGCTIYYCLTGHAPFPGGDLDETFRRHQRAARPSVRDVRPDVPEEFDHLIQWMMASDHRERPTPKLVMETLDRLMPRLSDRRPALPARTELPQIDVVCPHCGTQYHLSPDSAGRRMRCPNKLCRAVFAAAMTAQIDDSPTQQPADATVDSPEVLGARIARAEGYVEPPPVQTAVSVPASGETSGGTGQEIPTIPLEAVVTETSADAGETPPTGAPGVEPTAVGGRRKRRSRRRQRTRRIKWLVATTLLVLCGASAVIAWKFLPPDFLYPNPDTRWTQITDYVAEHKWDRALRGLEAFGRQFPEDPRNAQIPFFIDLCRAGKHIYGTTGNPEKGLASVRQIFRDHRDNPAYEQYYIDLHRALDRLIVRFTEDAAAELDPTKVSAARQAYELLQTVTLATEEDWVRQRTRELGSEIEVTGHNVRVALAAGNARELLEKAAGPDPGVNADEIYARVETIFEEHPTLRDEPELQSLQERAYAAEATRPRFLPDEPDSQDALPSGSGYDLRRGNTMVVVWGEEPERVMVWSEARGHGSAALPSAVVWNKPPPSGRAEVVLALARGILHALDADSGSLLWARRLGIDSDRLPGRIRATDTSPAALLAVSTEQNRLLALEESTGSLRWQYPAGSTHPADPDAIVATLTIVDPRRGPREPGNGPRGPYGLLPTAKGEIHVLELARGKRLGRYVTGQSMTLEGTYDAKTGLVFFPADAKRIYAIDPAAMDDPQRPVCRSVLLTDHASGALRSPPVVVGQYLIISEAAELEHTRLRAYRITASGFPSPTVEPQKALTLAGWSWFRPHCTPDRITMVTDVGRLGVFGLNLDNPSEALYRIVSDWDIHSNTPYRPLAVHAQEHLLWIMAGGRLQKLSVDVVHGEIHSLWPDANTPVAGIPIHEAQTDRFARRFFLATMSTDGRVYRFTAVDSQQGSRLWQRQLGVVPLGDPLPWKDGTLLIDQTGRTLALRPKAAPLAGGIILRQDGDDGEVIRLDDPRDPDGPIHLVAPREGGTRLAVCRVDRDPQPGRPPAARRVVPLDGRLHGRPCICGEFVVVPYADGRLDRIALDPHAPGSENVNWFSWSRQDPGPGRAEVYSLGPTEVLLIDRRRRVRRLQLYSEKQGLQWKQSGEAFHLPSALSGRPLLWGDHLYLFDSEGTLYRLALDDPGDLSRQKQWPLGLKITRGPFLRGDYLLAIADGRKLVCVAPGAAQQAERSLWIAGGFRGRIRGMPQLSGDTLLVADNSRRVTGIRLGDGKMVWKIGLPLRVGPSAAPVPCSTSRMLLPLADGTLLEMPIPGQQLAEARK